LPKNALWDKKLIRNKTKKEDVFVEDIKFFFL
jgi:hypothetical protein